MDIDSRLGSLFIIGFPGPHLDPGMEIWRDIVNHGLGGVILFNRCLHTPTQPANIVSAAQVTELCAALQELAGGSLLIGVDQEGGMVRRLRPEAGFAELPSARRLGAGGERIDQTKKQAEISAAMLAEVGINCNFAPVVDLDTNPANPVIGAIERSFSSDPLTVAHHGAAWIEAHREKGILSCLKHFPGHGSSTADSHLGFVDISETWQRKELEPYRLLLQQNMVDLVMSGHLFHRRLDPEHPATLSAAIIDGLLRTELGYDGVVVSDDLQMKAITDHYSFAEAVCRSLAAGVDMLVFGNNLDYGPELCSRAIQAVKEGLGRGLISEARLHTALARVGRLKQLLEKTDD